MQKATAYIEASRDVQGRESFEVRGGRGKPRVGNKDPEAEQREPEAQTVGQYDPAVVRAVCKMRYVHPACKQLYLVNRVVRSYKAADCCST